MRKYEVQDRETGNSVEIFDSYEEAKNALEEYEAQDENNGIYEEDLYVIVEVDAAL
ncbi:hypothetical protein IB642_07375 [Allofrancisella guangzhouensis]|uniref:hypothetical protein n=1 Tax=Allofrancisella guangzhouensis TaxID=594679 RepID=UPI000B2F24C9|nr:hypothetical protein [Allofrancisella guangzhouensis]MBK2027848.1 hypothetical protein [Allofrancisella guangzhouensis]MBK2044835.1 hypothetical protein [Allofrancisella guangzhouensis]MBK2046295.1 hypothetical protein [Allofrancisella guangzhouensis]